MSDVYNEIYDIFTNQVSREYLGEDVTLVDHALQCAELAIQDNSPKNLVVAALLHDIGHLLIDESVEAFKDGIDLHHDEIGAQWVSSRFPIEVSEPIRLHVDAKRYLVTKDPAYSEKLSEASLKTFQMQGGYMTEFEIQQFLDNSYSEDAIQVRLWDDAGKIRGKKTVELADLRAYIEDTAK